MKENLNFELLQERSRRLAQKTYLPEEIKDAINIVVFALGNETYAVEVQKIKAIQPYENATRLPGLPPIVVGVINISGTIYTLIDLKQIFGQEATPDQAHHLIIIDHNALKVGFLVDEILDYRIISRKEIQSNLTGIKSKQKGFIIGMLKNSTVLIDVLNILSEINRLINKIQGE